MNLDNSGLLDISTMGKPGQCLMPDGTVLKPPEDIELIPRIMEELEARRRYGQPCERIELGADAWECALWQSAMMDSDPIRVIICLKRDRPTTVLLCGLKATCNPDIAPTCFVIQ